MSQRDFDPQVRPPSQQRANRQHNVCDDAWVRAFLHQAQIATISTAWDELPFNNPTMFWYDEAQHRLIFHSNIMGRVRANIDKNPKVCVSFLEMGRLLPSNAALEFSLQYRSVVVFGEAYVISEPELAQTALYQLITKYFPKMEAGVHYRPITEAELRQTSVYEIRITEWSGKENYDDQAEQIEEWSPLSADMLNGGFA